MFDFNKSTYVDRTRARVFGTRYKNDTTKGRLLIVSTPHQVNVRVGKWRYGSTPRNDSPNHHAITTFSVFVLPGLEYIVTAPVGGAVGATSWWEIDTADDLIGYQMFNATTYGNAATDGGAIRPPANYNVRATPSGQINDYGYRLDRTDYINKTDSVMVLAFSSMNTNLGAVGNVTTNNNTGAFYSTGASTLPGIRLENGRGHTGHGGWRGSPSFSAGAYWTGMSTTFIPPGGVYSVTIANGTRNSAFKAADFIEISKGWNNQG